MAILQQTRADYLQDLAVNETLNFQTLRLRTNHCLKSDEPDFIEGLTVMWDSSS